MEILSRCPLTVRSFLWQPRPGAWVLTAVAKATFALQPGESPLDALQDQPIEEDTPWDEDPSRSLRFASDMVPRKKRPEVLVVGHAHAPGGANVTSLVARLSVGEVDKAVQVIGDSHFTADGVLSAPARFVRMPLRWERAAGGPGTANPVGVRTGDEARPDGWGRVHVPNLLPVGVTVTQPGDMIAPAGFGPIARSWPDRAMRLHGDPAIWSAVRWGRAPMPVDFDMGYFNAAPKDQMLDELRGDERIVLEHLHPAHPRLSTRLATVRPRALVSFGAGAAHEVPIAPDTLVIDSDRGVAVLTYRAHVALDHPARQGWVVIEADAAQARVPVARPAVPKLMRETLPIQAADPAEDTPRFKVVPPPKAPLDKVPGKEAPAPPAVPFEKPPATLRDVRAAFGRTEAAVDTGALSHGKPALPFQGKPAAFDEAAMVTEDTAVPFDEGDTFAGGEREPAAQRSTPLPGEPAWLAAHGEPPAHEEGERASTTAALPFRRIEAAQVGGMALGRSMRLQPPRVEEPVRESDVSPAPLPPASPPPPPPVGLVPMVPVVPPPPMVPVVPPVPMMPVGVPPPMGPVGLAPMTPVPPFSPAGVQFSPITPLVPLSSGAAPQASFLPHVPQAVITPAAPLAPVTSGAPGLATGEEDTADGQDVSKPTEPPPPPRSEQVSLEECATIHASIELRPAARSEILASHDLTGADWTALRSRHERAIQADAKRRAPALLSKYDAAYLAQIEKERGPVSAAEYARVSLASETGEARAVLVEMGLPAAAELRIHRAWIGKIASDPALGAEVRAAIERLREEE